MEVRFEVVVGPYDVEPECDGCVGDGWFAFPALPRQVQVDVVRQHLAPLAEQGTPLSDTVPLFGGARIIVDGEVVLEPQCCGDLSDAWSWLQLRDPDFQRGVLCLEGHPSPVVERDGGSFRVVCEDEVETFSGAKASFHLDIEATLRALASIEVARRELRSAVREIAGEFPVADLTTLLIDGDEDGITS